MILIVIVLISFKLRERQRERDRERESHTLSHTHRYTHTDIAKSDVLNQVVLKISIMIFVILYLPVQVDSETLKYPSLHTSHLPTSIVHFPQF